MKLLKIIVLSGILLSLYTCKKESNNLKKIETKIDSVNIQNAYLIKCDSLSNFFYQMLGENSNYFITTKINEDINIDTLNSILKEWPYISITYKENFDTSFLKKNCPDYKLNDFAFYHFIELVSYKIDSNAYVFNESGFLRQAPFNYCGTLIQTINGKTLEVRVPKSFTVVYDKEVIIDYGKRCYGSQCQIGCSAYLKRIEYK
jgi:hypothetical protein